MEEKQKMIIAWNLTNNKTDKNFQQPFPWFLQLWLSQ